MNYDLEIKEALTNPREVVVTCNDCGCVRSGVVSNDVLPDVKFECPDCGSRNTKHVYPEIS